MNAYRSNGPGRSSGMTGPMLEGVWCWGHHRPARMCRRVAITRYAEDRLPGCEWERIDLDRPLSRPGQPAQSRTGRHLT